MNRRSFLAGAVAVGFATPRSLHVFSVNDPCISNLRADNLPTVGDKNDGGNLDNIITNVDVCEMNLEEDDKVLFHFRVTNTRNNQIQIFHCQPHSANSSKRVERFGPFGRVTRHDFFKAGTRDQGGWRADNDSNAFYAEVKIGGNWQRMGQLTQIRSSTDDKVAHMEWHQPHEVRFEVRAVDNR